MKIKNMASTSKNLLPEVLKPGTVFVAKRGNTLTLVGTSKKDDYGMKLFRLHHHSYRDGRWRMPDRKGSTLYSRDDLQSMNLTMVSEG